MIHDTQFSRIVSPLVWSIKGLYVIRFGVMANTLMFWYCTRECLREIHLCSQLNLYPYLCVPPPVLKTALVVNELVSFSHERQGQMLPAWHGNGRREGGMNTRPNFPLVRACCGTFEPLEEGREEKGKSCDE